MVDQVVVAELFDVLPEVNAGLMVNGAGRPERSMVCFRMVVIASRFRFRDTNGDVGYWNCLNACLADRHHRAVRSGWSS
ncbi:hypothetical protein [Streptomyces sp. WAC01280]|uniref:hypothetical protein n=1 Tax=Streptomyces sp. WAC01280 TaxID=2487424 RepID=UPI000F799F98|nr:hypothetical protein [Streptomyces sp. WAC01280]RSS57417.1 hypothetical protein EF909_15790 [Streptomyces sp. WAC01280]